MQSCPQRPQGAVSLVPQPRDGGVHIRDDRIGYKGGMHFGVETHRLDLGGTEQILGQAQVTEQFKTGIVEQAIDTARRGPRRVVQRGEIVRHRQCRG